MIEPPDPAAEQGPALACEEVGLPYSLVGDANKPGDFLSCLRDAWMVALSLDHWPRPSNANAAKETV